MNMSAPGLRLDIAATEFYSNLRLAPFLRQLLSHSGNLVGAVAGSISLVDTTGHRYTKLAERGASCQLGRSFPLSEGATGQVVARRRPVVLNSYGQVPRGHLTAGHAATNGAVAAIPIWWRGDIIGVNVLFAGGPRRFTVEEVDELEILTQLAAAGLARAGARDPLLSQLIREQPRSARSLAGVDTVVTEVGKARTVSPSVAQVALDLVTLAERAVARRHSAARLHVAVVHREEGLRLLVHDTATPEGAANDSLAGVLDWQELVDTAGGGVSVEHVPGWGTLLRADLPYEHAREELAAGPSPFTRREQEVLKLLAEGAGDKKIAQTLLISPKTVEKHVGAVLRKTEATSRTAAVMRALDRGWVAGIGSVHQV